VSDLRKNVQDGSVKVLNTLLKVDPLEDFHTKLTIPYILKKYFKYLRNRLTRLILGKDVILFFVKDTPIELSAEEEYELILDLDPILAEKLRIRKASVAERFLATDLVFRLYYFFRETRIVELIEKLRKLENKICLFRQSALYEMKMRNYTPFEFAEHPHAMDVRYPVMLNGFISSNFPLLSKSGIFQMALMLHAKDELFKEYGRIPFENPQDFVTECEIFFERSLNRYESILERFINEVEAILKEKDPIEEFILSQLPTTILELFDKVGSYGYDVKDVNQKLKELIRLGKIKVEGDRLVNV